MTLLMAADLHAASLSAFAEGFSDTTPGFWGVEFLPGDSDARVQSITLELPSPAFFDFETSPILDVGTTSGLAAGDVSFSFSGADPVTLGIAFLPGAFAPGDRLQFAASIDGLGSQLGGALGAFGGVRITVRLADGRTGSSNFVTETSIRSGAEVDIAGTAIPEPNAFSLLVAGGLVLCAKRRLAAI